MKRLYKYLMVIILLWRITDLHAQYSASSPEPPGQFSLTLRMGNFGNMDQSGQTYTMTVNGTNAGSINGWVQYFGGGNPMIQYAPGPEIVVTFPTFPGLLNVSLTSNYNGCTSSGLCSSGSETKSVSQDFGNASCGSMSIQTFHTISQSITYRAPVLTAPWPSNEYAGYFRDHQLICAGTTTIQTYDHNIGDRYMWQVNRTTGGPNELWETVATTNTNSTSISAVIVANAIGVTPESLLGQSLWLRVAPIVDNQFCNRASQSVHITFGGAIPTLADITMEQACPGMSDGAITFSNVRYSNGTLYDFNTAPGLTFAVGLEINGAIFSVQNYNSANGGPFRINNLQAGRWVTALFLDTNTAPPNEFPTGCTAFLQPVQMQSITQASFNGSILPDLPTCRGGADGSLAVNIQGGRGPFTYSLNGSPVLSSIGNRSAVLPNLASGNHTVQVRDEGCNFPISQATLIGVPASVQLATDQVLNAACAGSSSGIIAVGTVNGAGNYMYSLQNESGTVVGSNAAPVSSSTYSFSTLPAGNYRAFVTDANGCSDTRPSNGSQWLSVTVAAPISASVSPVSVLCNAEAIGNGTGQLIFTASGGSGSYRYFANGIERISNHVTGLNAGDYIPMVMDAQAGASTCTWGGTAAFIQTIGEPSGITLTVDENIQPSCYGFTDGRIGVTASGGTSFLDGSYIYTLNSVTRGFIESQSGISFSSFTLTLLRADTYYFSIRDRNDCVVDSRNATAPIVVGQPDRLRINPVLSVVSGGLHNITCAGTTNGWVRTNPTGGTAPFTANFYVRSNLSVPLEEADNIPLSGSATFSGYGAGSYRIVLEDAHGCDLDLDTLLREPVLLVLAPVTIRQYAGGINISCHGSADGQIAVDATGGNFPYSLTINGGTPTSLGSGQVPHTIGGFIAGNYTVTITDPNGCRDQEVINLYEPQPLRVSDRYISNPGASPFEVRCHGNVEILSIVTTGGSGDRTVEINGVTRPVPTGAAANFPGLGANTYTYTITDANSCLLSDNVTITEPAAISLNASETLIDKPRCFGEKTASLQVRAVGGVKISGTHYQYVLTHRNVPRDLPFVFDRVRQQEGDLVLFEELIAGEYELAVYDRFSCLYSSYITIETEAQIALSISTNSITCKGDANGSGSVTLSGGSEPYRLIWQDQFHQHLKEEPVNDGVPVMLNDLEEAIYYLRISDASGCEFYNPNFTFEVHGPENPLVLEAQPTMVACHGNANGMVILQSSGGWQESTYRFGTDPSSLSIGNTFYEDLAPGTYRYYVEDSRGCIDHHDVIITEPQTLTSDIFSHRMVSCNSAGDGNFTLLVEGGTTPYEVSLDAGSHWQQQLSFANLVPGTYNAQIQDANGCTSAQSVVITEPTILTSALTSQINTLCKEANGAATVMVNGGTVPYEIEWRNAQNTIIDEDVEATALLAGNYQFKAIDANNCITELTARIINTNDIVFEVTNVADVSCYGSSNGRASLSISQVQAPYTINWDNGSTATLVSNLLAGTHRVTLSDANRCDVTKEFLIGTPTALAILIDSQTSPTCFGDCNGRITVSATGGVGAYAFEWIGKSITSRILSNACATDHSVRVRDSHGCELERTIVLSGPEEISLDIEDTYTICEGQEVDLNAGSWRSTHWNSDSGFTSEEDGVILTRAGLYELSVTDEKGCDGRAAFEIIYSTALLSAEFLLPKETFVGDTIVCIEISNPEPSEISWEYDKGSIRHLTSEGAYKELIFTEPGEFDITLTAKLGGCTSRQTKTIIVYEGEEELLPGGRLGYEESGIKEFKIFPNPTDGKFKAKVVLYKVREVKIRLAGLNGNIMDQHVETGSNEYELDFDIRGQSPGVYWLIGEADGKVKTVKVLIY